MVFYFFTLLSCKIQVIIEECPAASCRESPFVKEFYLIYNSLANPVASYVCIKGTPLKI